WSDELDGGSHDLEEGLGGFERLPVAADHDRENTLNSTGLAATDRGVQASHPGGRGCLVNRQRFGGTDRGVVDEQRAGVEMTDCPVLAEQDLVDDRAVRQHRDEHLAASGG